MTRSTRALLRLGGVIVLAATISACGGAAASGQPAATDTPASATPVAPAPATSGAESIAPPPTTLPASVVVPSLTADTPLVDILPTELGGFPTQKAALVGSDMSGIDSTAAMVFGELLEVLGADGADLTAGVAANSSASVIAIRVAGKSAQEISDAMIAGRALNGTTERDALALGGKQVVRVKVATASLPFYVYGTQDVSFTIAGADEGIVAEALSKLP